MRFLDLLRCLRRCHDGAHDLVIAGASAQIAGERETDLVLSEIGFLLQERRGRHDKAGCTKTTLQRPMLDECLLHGMKFAICRDPFHRGDLGTVCFNGEDQTRVRSGAVKMDCTTAAITVAAALFGAHEAEPVTQHIKQGLAGIDNDAVLFAVHFDIDFTFHAVVPLTACARAHAWSRLLRVNTLISSMR